MRRKSIAILLTPSRLEVVLLCGGRAEGGVVTSLDAASWETAWSAALRPLDEALRASVETVNGRGLEATVLHAGPEALVQLFSYPGKRLQAQHAATLALGEQFGGPLAECPHAVSFVGADREGEPVQSHFIGCANTEHGARLVADWAVRAGLKIGRIAPVEAGTLASMAQRAVEGKDPGVLVSLRLGEDGSALGASDGGSLRMLRPVDVDMGVLVEAITRPIQTEQGGASVTLTHEEARAMLFEHGVPERAAVLDAGRGLRGSDLLPLLQPVLQRCVVQVRQTLRFGLDDGAKSHARLRVEGPGSRIPGLAALIAEETGLPLESAGGTGAGFDSPGYGEGDLMTALAALPRDVSLVPRAVAAAQRERKFKRMLAAGVALAGAAVGIDAAMTSAEYGATLGQIRAVSASAAEARSLLEARTAYESRRGALGAVKNAAGSLLGGGVPWSAVMREIALAAPTEIRIIELSTRREGGGSVLFLRGYLLSPDGSTPDPRGIGAFLNTLAESPLCASVSMGDTQRSMMESRGALQFSATVRCHELPLLALAGSEVSE